MQRFLPMLFGDRPGEQQLRDVEMTADSGSPEGRVFVIVARDAIAVGAERQEPARDLDVAAVAGRVKQGATIAMNRVNADR